MKLLFGLLNMVEQPQSIFSLIKYV